MSVLTCWGSSAGSAPSSQGPSISQVQFYSPPTCKDPCPHPAPPPAFLLRSPRSQLPVDQVLGGRVGGPFPIEPKPSSPTRNLSGHLGLPLTRGSGAAPCRLAGVPAFLRRQFQWPPDSHGAQVYSRVRGRSGGQVSEPEPNVPSQSLQFELNFRS